MDRRHIPSPRRAFAAVLLTLALAPLPACDSGASSGISVSGSTTIMPIAEVAAERFEKANPGVDVLVSGVGSSAGIESVSQGTVDIGTSSRDLKDEEESLGLTDSPIAIDAIAVVVNPDNPVRELTTAQVKDIFQGRITNWSEVGGPDMSIGLVNRDEASGTREAFSKIVLDKEPFDPGAVVLPGTGQVRAVVRDSEGAIGYISLGFVTDEVRPLAVEGVVPSRATVMSGTYPIQRTLHLFTKGAPAGLPAEFIAYMLSTEVQTEVVRDAGFLPIAEGGKQ